MSRNGGKTRKKKEGRKIRAERKRGVEKFEVRECDKESGKQDKKSEEESEEDEESKSMK